MSRKPSSPAPTEAPTPGADGGEDDARWRRAESPSAASPAGLLDEHVSLRDDEVLDRQQQLTQTGTWGWSPVGDEVDWSPNYFRLLGYEPGAVQPTRQRFLDHVHPLDGPIVLDAMAAQSACEFRIVRCDGATRYVRATPLAHHPAADGRPERQVGVVQDLTEARRSDAILEVHAVLAEGLTGWTSLEQDAGTILARVATAIQCFRGVLWVPRGDVMLTAAYWDENGLDQKDRILELPVRYGVGVSGTAWQQRDAICITDVRAIAGFEHRDLTDAAGIRGMLVLPLLDGERVVALVGFASHAKLVLSGSEHVSLLAFSRTLGRFLAARGLEPVTPLLSRRELELLQLAAEGLGGSAIAEQLFISRETVKTHFTSIYAKLAVTNRAAAVADAMRRGLLS